MVLDREQRRHADRADLADPTEVVADEIDDHHVLGLVLGQEAVGRRRGALDRRRPHQAALAAQEALGRRRRHVQARRRHPHDRGVGRRVADGQGRAERGDVGVVAAPGPTGSGSGSPGRRRRPRSRARIVAHATLEPVLVERRAPRVARRSDPSGSPPRASRTDVANRAKTAAPVYGTTAAQNPVPSRHAGSSVTSTRSVHRRSPTTASGD